jgi:hypothetical protein
MNPDHWPITVWAERKPRVRWPLVLALIAAIYGIAGAIEQASQHL